MAIDYKALTDLLNPKEEERLFSPMTPTQDQLMTPANPTPEQLASIMKQQAPEPEVKTSAQPIVKQSTPKKEDVSSAEDKNLPPSPEAPMSKSEALIAEYNKLLGKGEQDLAEARKRDRMLKVGGALGDALATYLNAQGQMNVKAPGVQVQQGAGLGEIASMFATAPEIASDVATRRESMMKQYAELAKGERAKTRLESEEKRADAADKRARELAQMQIEGNLKVAGIKASGKGAEKPLTLYQENQIKREADKDLQKLSTSVTKLGLPTITSAINSLEKQLGMTLEEALSKNTDEDNTNDVEIPGYGRVGSLYPSTFVGDKSRAFRQDVNSLLNPQISKQFGASQTKGEIERFQEEVGGGKFESQTAILRGLSNIKRSAKADLNAVYAGFKPELVDTYKNREGITLDTVKKEEVFPKTVTNRKTKETATVENEQELKEALAEGFE